MLRLSHYTQIVDCGKDLYVAYHSLFGMPIIIDKIARSVFKDYESPREQHPENDPRLSPELAEQLSYLIVEDDFDDRKLLQDRLDMNSQVLERGERVKYLSLITSESCNFRCSYCFAEPFSDQRTAAKLMQPDIAFKAIDSFCQLLLAKGKKEADINFGGGEPLINFNTIKLSVEYLEEQFPQIRFTFGINTNASLINAEVAHFFKDHAFRVTTSLDGLPSTSDKVRKLSNSKPASPMILSGFDALEEAGIPIDGFAITINETNYDEIDEKIIDWAENRGYNHDLRFDLDAIHMVRIDPDEVIQKLMRLKRYGANRGILVHGFWDRPIENLFSSILEEQTGFCGGQRGESMCVAPNGDIFVCGYSGIKVGSVIEPNQTLPNPTYTDLIKSRYVGRNERCRGCEIEGQCMGGCLICEEFAKKSHSSALDFNCRLYRGMTVELLKEQAINS